jgi:beta-fructofuranosidase
MPQGNYAARVSEKNGRHLVWNFFFKGLTTRGSHLMAPPKELAVDAGGHLRLKTFSGFNDLIAERYRPVDLEPLEPLLDNPHGTGEAQSTTCRIGCDSGFEAFLLRGEYRDFMLGGSMNLEGQGKCGLVFRLDDQGDGYYLSLDLFKGIAQIRAWGRRPDGGLEEAFEYDQLQAGFTVAPEEPHDFCLLAYEQYIEFSLSGYVLLTLADDRYAAGRIGFYVESARMRVDDLELKTLRAPTSESYPTCISNY